MKYIPFPYLELDQLELMPCELRLLDHLYGFDQNFNNIVLDKLQTHANLNNIRYKIEYHEILDKKIKDLYPNLQIEINADFINVTNMHFFHSYSEHPAINYKNFICSFNGSDHVGRKLLTAILHRFGYFTDMYCSKNFKFTTDKLDGHIYECVSERNNFYQKFFIEDNNNKFFDKIVSFGHVRFKHLQNIHNLELKLTQSFLHIVSESMATSYAPFVTEKFLYSVVTRGLFLAYAQPGWHAHLEKYYGFKKYNKLFDYRFDNIQNPVERLLELMTMVSKFSILTPGEWRDLYLLEQDTIEFNYNHYFNGGYLEQLKKYEN